MLVGPNGAGKTTLLKAIAGLLPATGSIQCQTFNLQKMKNHERAKIIGMLSQENALELGFTVREFVEMGRYAHERKWLNNTSRSGSNIVVESALRCVGMDRQTEQAINTLSGGEKQRVCLARLMAQQPSVMLLDEPANHLDLSAVSQVFSMVDEWRSQAGHAVISVVHDLTIARRYGTHFLLLNHGQQIAYGSWDDVMTTETLNQTWNMDVEAWMRNLYGLWVKSVST